MAPSFLVRSHKRLSYAGVLRAALPWSALEARDALRMASGAQVSRRAPRSVEHAAHGHGPQGGLYFISSRAQAFLESTYTVLGGWIEKNHHAAMLIGVLLLVSGIPGTFFLSGAAQFLWFRVDSDLHAFARLRARMHTNNTRILSTDTTASSIRPRTALVVMSPKNNDKVLSFPFLHKALEIMNAVYNISVEDGGGTRYGFADLCLPSGDAPEHMWFDHSSHRQGGEHGSGEQGLNEADITYCASRAADIFAAPVNWDPVLLTELAGPNAVERRAEHARFRLCARTACDRAEPRDARRVQRDGRVPGEPQVRRCVAELYGVGSDHSANRPRARASARSQPHAASGGMGNGDGSIIDFRTRTSTPTTSRSRASRDRLSRPRHSLLWALTPWIFVVVGVMVVYLETFLFTQTRTAQSGATQMCSWRRGQPSPASLCFLSDGCITSAWKINVLCICAVFLVAAVVVVFTFIFVSAMIAADAEHEVGGRSADGDVRVRLRSPSPPSLPVCAFAVAAGDLGAQPAFLKFNLVMARGRAHTQLFGLYLLLRRLAGPQRASHSGWAARSDAAVGPGNSSGDS